MSFVRHLRLIPVIVLAAGALFLLKVSAIVIEGGYTLIASHAALAQGLGEGVRTPAFDLPPPTALDDTARAPRGDRARSWVRDIYGPPEYTGSVPEVAPPAPIGVPPGTSGKNPDPVGIEGTAPGPPDMPKLSPSSGGAVEATAPGAPDMLAPSPSPGERVVLESLQRRRQELEARAREMEVRESLLNAAEKRIELRLQELKELEVRLTGIASKKDEAEIAKFKSLVSMYENMKAKDAAKVFDRLNMRVLVEVVNAMNPRRMSDILGQMTPEVAERLTMEIANRAGPFDKRGTPAELPEVEGRPTKL